MSWSAKMWSWAPMARAHAEKRAQREQAGSREEKRRRSSQVHQPAANQTWTHADGPSHTPDLSRPHHPSPEDQPSDEHGTRKGPHIASCRKDKFKNPLPMAAVLCLPCYRENLKHKRLVCICVLGENTSLVSTLRIHTTVVFSIHVMVSFSSVGPRGWTCRSTSNIGP